MAFHSLEPLSITSDRYPKTILTMKMNVLNPPLLG